MQDSRTLFALALAALWLGAGFLALARRLWPGRGFISRD